MTRAKIIKAMPLGSRWNGFHLQGGKWVPQKGGTRTVSDHKAHLALLDRADFPGDNKPAILDYPKRTDAMSVLGGGSVIVIEYKNERGVTWSSIKYEKVEE